MDNLKKRISNSNLVSEIIPPLVREYNFSQVHTEIKLSYTLAGWGYYDTIVTLVKIRPVKVTDLSNSNIEIYNAYLDDRLMAKLIIKIEIPPIGKRSNIMEYINKQFSEQLKELGL